MNDKKNYLKLFEQSKVKYLTGILVLSLLPYFLLSYFVTPSGDDFSYATGSLNNGWINSQISYYTRWTGRYTATFVQTTAPRFGNYLETYKIFPFLLLSFTFFAFWCFFSALLKRKFFQKEGIFPALLFMSIYINTMPTVLEGFYWLSAAYTYQFGLSLSLLLISVLLTSNNSIKTETLKIISIIILAFIASGCSEIVSFILLSILFLKIIIIFNVNKPSRSKRFYILAFFIVLFSFLIVFLAPGNALRSKCFPYRHQFGIASSLTINWIIFLFKHWLSSPLLVISILYSLPFARKIGLFYNLHKLKTSHIIFFIFYLIAVFITAIFLPAFATGSELALRTANPQHFFAIFAVFFVTILLSQKLPYKFIKKIKKGRLNIIISLLFCVSLISTANFPSVASDLAIASKYKEQCNQRYKFIAKSKKQGKFDLKLPPVNYPYCPVSIAYYDITLNKNHFMNTGLASFFGLKSVVMDIPKELLSQKRYKNK